VNVRLIFGALGCRGRRPNQPLRRYVLTGRGLLEGGRRLAGWPLDRDRLPLETTGKGLFAAGDVRSGSTKRVAGAVGEGAMSVALVHRRLEALAAAAA
jgi:thioredoxin reductase (NADPH)